MSYWGHEDAADIGSSDLLEVAASMVAADREFCRYGSGDGASAAAAKRRADLWRILPQQQEQAAEEQKTRISRR